MQMTVKELKEVIKNMRDDALVCSGLEEDGGMYKITSYEFPTGEPKDWDFINLAYER